MSKIDSTQDPNNWTYIILKHKIKEHSYNEFIIKFKYLYKSLVRKKEDFWFEKKIAKKLNLDLEDFINSWQSLKKEFFEIDKNVLKIIKNLES